MKKSYLKTVRRELMDSRKDIRWLLYGALLVPSITLIVDSIALLFGLFFPSVLPKVSSALLVTILLLWTYCVLLKNDLERHKKYLVKYSPSGFDIDAVEYFDDSFDEAAEQYEKKGKV